MRDVRSEGVGGDCVHQKVTIYNITSVSGIHTVNT